MLFVIISGDFVVIDRSFDLGLADHPGRKLVLQQDCGLRKRSLGPHLPDDGLSCDFRASWNFEGVSPWIVTTEFLKDAGVVVGGVLRWPA